MKNKTYVKSVWIAMKGLVYAVKTEKNFKYHTLIALIFMVINLVVKTEMWGWIGYIITVCGVMASEMVNTAIEHTINMISREIREDIRIAKDIGAGVVLCWGIGFFIIEGAILVNYLQSFQ